MRLLLLLFSLRQRWIGSSHDIQDFYSRKEARRWEHNKNLGKGGTKHMRLGETDHDKINECADFTYLRSHFGSLHQYCSLGNWLRWWTGYKEDFQQNCIPNPGTNRTVLAILSLLLWSALLTQIETARSWSLQRQTSPEAVRHLLNRNRKLCKGQPVTREVVPFYTPQGANWPEAFNSVTKEVFDKLSVQKWLMVNYGEMNCINLTLGHEM